jgi:hypothetical protein
MERVMVCCMVATIRRPINRVCLLIEDSNVQG